MTGRPDTTRTSATKRVDVIPTPQEIVELATNAKEFTDREVYHICGLSRGTEKFDFALRFLQKNLSLQFGIHTNICSERDRYGPGDIVVCTDKESAENAAGTRVDDDFFENPNAREQGYVLESRSDRPVLIYAESDQGCLNGIATLLQLFRETEPVKLDALQIRDYPEFRFRGNKWTIWCELGVWSYDWGDGLEAFKRRTIRKLDMSVLYKVNMILFDGYGWDFGIFPEYSSLMLELNREARLRGISLVYVGQSSGFCLRRNMIDPVFYRGEVLENRSHYPDGEVYECIGGEIYAGTCLSNDELIEKNIQSIIDFVDTVEPSGLYIHQLDILGLPQSMWDSRCPECRNRWPNDSLVAEDGMAGAYAEYYRAIVTRINQAKSANYDPVTDCQIILISPGYLDSVAVEDEEWNLALKYWSKVSRLLPNHENLHLGFREMFYHHLNDRRRIEELKSSINDSGNGHQLAILHFYGGDGWQGEQLFLTTPALNYVFLGADMLLTASGHAFQEPQQLLNSEFMWNPSSSSYRLDEEPTTYSEFLALYNKSRHDAYTPASIYGDGELLALACRKLYGGDAGPIMAKFFSLRGKTGKSPASYLRNKELNTTPGPDGALENWIGFSRDYRVENLVEARETFLEIAQMNTQAKDILDGIDPSTVHDKEALGDIAQFKDFLAAGARYLTYLKRYIEIFETIDQRSSSGEAVHLEQQLTDQIQDLDRALFSESAANNNSRLQAVDDLEGALSGRRIIVDFIRPNLEHMMQHLQISGG